MTLHFPQHTGILSSTNKSMHNVESQICGYFGIIRKKIQNFDGLRYLADICFFAIKPGNFGKCFLGTV